MLVRPKDIPVNNLPIYICTNDGSIAMNSHPMTDGILRKSSPFLRPKRSIIGPLNKHPKGVEIVAMLAEI